MGFPMRGYPFHRLLRLSRADADALRQNARSGPLAGLLRGAGSTVEWLGAPLSIEVGPAVRPPPGLDPVLAVLLENAAGVRAALSLDPTLAHALVERTLGGEDPDIPSLGPLTDVELGVLAYALARWLASGQSCFFVATVLTSWTALDEALGPGQRWRWPLEIHLGRMRGSAALLMTESATADPPVRAPAWATDLPIELAVVVAMAELPARAVAELEPGDVVVPDGCSLRAESGRLAGRVTLAQTRGRGAWAAELREGALEIVDVELRANVSAAEVNVKDSGPLLDRMGDTPVTLAVELARITLPLGEIASLAPGEVLQTGAPIGAHVALRAGDRVIAEGELVDVEGELGVRITRTVG